MKTLAVIGASYLQLPLVRKAKEMGLRVLCFAWPDGAVCKEIADKFYPISIIEKDKILRKCIEEQIDGITSIASDVAVPTIAYVASCMGLIGNSVESALKSTNKYEMRKALSLGGVAVPHFAVVSDPNTIERSIAHMHFPLIVKPVDRSGSLGVMQVENLVELRAAIDTAIGDAFSKTAIVEECITQMREVSVEGISWEGEYHFLQVTDKVTTGHPNYVELAHHQPANVSEELKTSIRNEVEKGVAALGIENGASHAELMITEDGSVFMTEIGARMGGDFIGSDLVRLSTGYDFLRGVIEVALGNFSGITCGDHSKFAGVWFYAPQTTWVKGEILKAYDNHSIVSSCLLREEVIDLACSADRSGYFIYASDTGRIGHE